MLSNGLLNCASNPREACGWRFLLAFREQPAQAQGFHLRIHRPNLLQSGPPAQFWHCVVENDQVKRTLLPKELHPILAVAGLGHFITPVSQHRPDQESDRFIVLDQEDALRTLERAGLSRPKALAQTPSGLDSCDGQTESRPTGSLPLNRSSFTRSAPCLELVWACIRNVRAWGCPG